jgi:hypothetical protein
MTNDHKNVNIIWSIFYMYISIFGNNCSINNIHIWFKYVFKLFFSWKLFFHVNTQIAFWFKIYAYMDFGHFKYILVFKNLLKMRYRSRKTLNTRRTSQNKTIIHFVLVFLFFGDTLASKNIVTGNLPFSFEHPRQLNTVEPALVSTSINHNLYLLSCISYQ